MLAKAIVNRLKQIVGDKNVITSKVALIAYGYDATLLAGMPVGVVFPGNTEEVVELVKAASELDFTLVPRGAGTNLSGGALGDVNSTSVVIAFSRMKKIWEIDTENFLATIEPGYVNFEFQEELAKKGFYYPPDPASYKAATMGGNLGECSGGPRCFKYGVTRDYVLGLEVVLMNGKVIQTGGRNFKSECGLDLTRIFVGAEGTLGLITKVTVRILPLPPAKRTMLAIFHKAENASQTVADIVAAGIVPTTLEMMDGLMMIIAEDANNIGLPRDAGALLIIEVDGYDVDLDGQVNTISDICAKNNVREFKLARTAQEVDKIWLARRTAIGACGKRRPSYSMQDITVPRSVFPAAVSGIIQCASDLSLEIGILAHAGDGNFHPMVLFDQRLEDESHRVHQAEGILCRMALDLKGSITGEHGIGLLKKPFMDKQFSPVGLEVFRKIKRSFDPANRLNPGKIIDL
ncbi:MAG: FAD-linked oxidase C-terminal domain-containing protein [Negativicutes bacterium]|nr:FAD-linked oxidase C-terminal domain-containing protein [Negativicutes bacterium]